MKNIILLLLVLTPFKMIASAEDSLEALINKAKNPEASARILSRHAVKIGPLNPNKSIVYLREAAQLLKNSDSLNLKSKIFYNLCYFYINLSNMDSAYYFNTLALSGWSKTGNKPALKDAYNTNAAIFWQLKNLPKAEFYFKKSFDISKSLSDSNGMGVAISNIAVLKANQGKQDSGLYYLIQSLEFFRDHSLPQYNSILGNIANSYIQLNQPEKAIKYAQPLLAWAEKTGNFRSGAIGADILGRTYSMLHKYDSAEVYVKQSIAFSRQVGAQDMLVVAYATLAEIYKSWGKPALAVQWMEQYITLKDSMANVENTSRINELETKYNTKQKEVEIIRLEGIHTANKKALVFTSIVIGITVMVAIIIFFFMGRFRRLSIELAAQKEEISKQKMKSDALSAVKDKLFSIISHDLRSPLASLDATTKLLRNSKMDPETTNELLNNLDVSLAATINLMDGLLMWSLSQMKNMELKPVSTNLKAVAAENIAMYRETAKNKGVKLNNSVDDSINLMVDMHMMQIVARNLISNAIKYSYEGGEVLISTKEENNEVVFSVKDNGMGLVSEQIRNILDTGARVNSKTGTGEEKGTGIGLAICNEILKKSGGYMTIDSVPEKGTTVSVHFPAQLIS